MESGVVLWVHLMSGQIIGHDKFRVIMLVCQNSKSVSLAVSMVALGLREIGAGNLKGPRARLCASSVDCDGFYCLDWSWTPKQV